MILTCLASSAFSLIFDCKFSERNYGIILSTYTCEFSVIKSGSEILLDSVNGAHRFGRSNVDVKTLTVSNNKFLNQIPLNVDKIFPNIVMLEWFAGNLTTLFASDLKQFPNLKVLSLEENKLISIAGDLFRNNVNLQFLYFGKNLLEHVDRDLLTSLTELKQAVFTGNPCINSEATTKEEIQDLNLQLPINCPMSNLTTNSTIRSGECLVACLSGVGALEEQVQSEFDKLRNQNNELRDLTMKNDEKLLALENRF